MRHCVSAHRLVTDSGIFSSSCFHSLVHPRSFQWHCQATGSHPPLPLMHNIARILPRSLATEWLFFGSFFPRQRTTIVFGTGPGKEKQSEVRVVLCEQRELCVMTDISFMQMNLQSTPHSRTSFVAVFWVEGCWEQHGSSHFFPHFGHRRIERTCAALQPKEHTLRATRRKSLTTVVGTRKRISFNMPRKWVNFGGGKKKKKKNPTIYLVQQQQFVLPIAPVRAVFLPRICTVQCAKYWRGGEKC